MKKKCKYCKKNKLTSDFYGVQGECKECTKKRVRENRLKNKEYYIEYEKNRQRYNIKRIISHKYSMMKMASEGRSSHARSCFGKEICSKAEFFNWFQKTEKDFMRLYKKWKNNNFDRKLTPSIDRINNNKGYTIDNLQWLSLSENCKKFKGNKKNDIQK